MSKREKIFISYSRKDGQHLAQRLHRDLNDVGYESFIDTVDIKGGESWVPTTESAIERCDVMLVLLSKGSYASDICRAEQLRALRKQKIVIPLLIQQDTDRPLHLEHLNYRDFSDLSRYKEAFETLIHDISDDISYGLPQFWHKTIVTAPPLPTDFTPRTAELAKLRGMIIGENTNRRVGLTALKGLGGIGKSVLASALCHDDVVQDAFPDGVLWVPIGRQPGNLVEQLKTVGQTLGDSIDLYNSESAATSRLRVILPQKAVLVVLDDVWDTKHVEPFLVDAPRCRILFTTRKGDISHALGAESFVLDVLRPAEAVALLVKRSSRDDPAFPQIAEQVGFLPLALKLVGARLSESNLAGKEWLESFHRASQLKLKRNPTNAHESVLLCFDLSTNELSENDRQLYFALGIFPQGLEIPINVIRRLWSELNLGMDDINQDDLILELERISLLEHNRIVGKVRLHDLLSTYNQEKLGVSYPNVHKVLLDAYNPKHLPWWQIQHDGYLYNHLIFHLCEAKMLHEMYDLLFSSDDWMEKKYRTFKGDNSYVADLQLARNNMSDPLTPPELLRIAQNQVARGVAHYRMQKYTDLDLETMVLLTRESEALNIARLRPTVSESIISLLVINAALRELGQIRTEIIEEAQDLLKMMGGQEIKLQTVLKERMINQTKSGDFAGAEKTILEAKDAKEHFDISCELAVLMAQYGQDNKVKNLLSELMEQASKLERKERLVQTLVKAKQFTLANEILEGITNKDERIKALTSIGSGHADRKQLDDAQMFLKEAWLLLQEEKSNRLELFTELAIAFGKAGCENDAREVFEATQDDKYSFFRDEFSIFSGESTNNDNLYLLVLAYAEAGDIFSEKAAKIARSISENDWRRISALSSLAVSLKNSGHIEEAIKVFIEAESNALKISQNSWHKEAALSRLANAYAKVNFIVESSRVFRYLEGLVRTIPDEVDSKIWDDLYSPTYDRLAKPAGDETPRARRAMAAASNKLNGLIEIGHLLSKKGKLKGAEKIYLKALELARGILSERGRSKVFSRLAISLSQIGSKTTAEEVFSETRKIINGNTFRTHNISIGPRVNALCDLAVGLEKSGFTEDALLTFKEAEIVARVEADQFASNYYSLRYLAGSLSEVDYVDEAIQIAMSISNSGDVFPFKLMAERQMAMALQEIAVYLAQKRLYAKAQEVLGHIPENEKTLRAWGLSYLSIELAKDGFYEKAADLLEASKKEAYSGSEGDIAFTLTEQAIAATRLGREDEATKLFDSAWYMAEGIDYGPWAHKDKPLAQSRVAQGLTQVNRFDQARKAVKEIGWFEVRSPAESFLITKLAEAGRFAEFFESIDLYGYDHILDGLILAVIDRSEAFNDFEDGLDISILLEITRIAGWTRHDWQEIHTLIEGAINS